MTTTESLQALPGKNSGQPLQRFPIVECSWTANPPASSNAVNGPPEQPKPWAKTVGTCIELVARATATADQAWMSAELVAHMISAVTVDRARLIMSVAAVKAKPVLEPLGFTGAHGSKTPHGECQVPTVS